ncbi:MAG: MATE family efflux transporter [Oscillospiraceae bacterium]
MKYNRSSLLLEEPNIYKAFIIMATPVFFSNFLKSIHDVVDTFFIGQMPDSVAGQAAISMSWPLMDILLSVSLGLAVAGVSIISQHLGACDVETAKNYAGMLFVFSAGLGLFLNAVLYIFAPTVMRMLGTEGLVFENSVTYLRVRSFEIVFFMIFNAFQAMRQAAGDTTSPVIISSMAVITNIFLTAIFVKRLGMGIYGAALATLIAQAAIVPLALVLTFNKNSIIYLELRHFKTVFQRLKLLVKVAIPAALGQAISSLGFLVINALILDYGPIVVAAFSNGNKISNLLLMPVFAIGSVQAAYIGQNIGAANSARAIKAYKVGRNLALLISIVGSIALFPLRHAAASMLSNSADVIEVCVEYMFWVLLIQPLMALYQNYMGTFNGTGKTKYSMILGSARLWCIRLPLIMFFKNFTSFGRNGIWYAMMISNILILIVGEILLRRIDFSKIALTRKRAAETKQP